ncbi:hypothetical protein VTN00DRAFT_7870 [Thermoascus crustaceus]|uniref:uncharacterized protein n=1 Tax=Thermoascus crustaceus TaxID=5088 RepID=UPI00374249E9
MTEPMPPIEQQTPTERKQQVAEGSAGAGLTTAQVFLPRVTIRYCTQCKWMLRAAYFAQELLSTFSTSLGEVALIPTTGGIFTVTILHASPHDFSTRETLLWDRKSMGGFPEVKQLKSLVRNIVDPGRDLGHVDRALGRENKASAEVAPAAAVNVSSPENTGGGRAGAARPSETVAVDVDTTPGMGTSSSVTAASGAAGQAQQQGQEQQQEGQRQGQEQGQGQVCEDCQ